jgi:hypothetical protein
MSSSTAATAGSVRRTASETIPAADLTLMPVKELDEAQHLDERKSD